jgi:flagellar motor switch protein FliM
LQTGDGDEESDRRWINNIELAAGDAEVQAKVELARVKIPVREFEDLEEGQVLFFKKPDYARLIVNDVPVYETSVGTHGTQVAIRVENPIQPEKTNE